MLYPVQFERDTNGTILVTFPDLPWVQSFGEDEADALEKAADALDTAIEYLVRHRQPIPMPRVGARIGVEISAMAVAKLAIHNLMLERRMSKAELGRRLRLYPTQVDRLIDRHHASRFEDVERAIGTLGKRLEVIVRPEVAAAANAPHRRARKVDRKR